MMVHARLALSNAIQLWHHYISAIRETKNMIDSPPHRQFYLLTVVCGRHAAAATCEVLRILKVPLLVVVFGRSTAAATSEVTGFLEATSKVILYVLYVISYTFWSSL